MPVKVKNLIDLLLLLLDKCELSTVKLIDVHFELTYLIGGLFR